MFLFHKLHKMLYGAKQKNIAIFILFIKIISQEVNMEFEPVIGLEVHAQLKTKTKIFCGCSTEFGAPPNSNTCPVCLGMPGVLPVLNKKAVEYAIRMALATNCTLNKKSIFARKNYFYPDLPKGYQISQYELPIAEHGHVDIELEDGTRKRIGITRIHMEEDAGKSSHDSVQPVSRVDLNRAGTPLIEIVSEPELRTPEEAGAYLRAIRAIVRYLDICDGNMEEGSFRCDANVSIRPKGREEFGTRTELKNINSFKFVEKAIQYEINRQESVILDGGQIVQETRLWDSAKNKTFSMRGKEDAHDYRYFPDPDLQPVLLSDSWIDEIKTDLPELPDQRMKRFMDSFGLPAYDADVLTSSRETAEFFEKCATLSGNAKLSSNWIMGNLMRLLNDNGIEITDSPVSAENLAKIIKLLDAGTINAKIAKTVFDEISEKGGDPEAIIKEKGLVQVSDTGAIEEAVDTVLRENPAEVEAYKGGKTKLISFFVGKIMKLMKGKANPAVVNQILEEKLK